LPSKNVGTKSTTITIKQVNADHVDTWARTVLSGFREDGASLSDQIQEDDLFSFFRARAIREGCYLFLATHAGEFAGGAVLQMQDGVALLRTASTQFAHRRLGIQQALIAKRLAFASDHGCRVAFSRANVGSASQRNLTRSGFQLFQEGCVFSKTAQ